MASYNKVFLMGNLTRDPEKRVTPDNLTIVKLGLAVNRRYTARDGEQREETTFVDIDAFGKQAEVIAQYCTKGSGLFVEGRLRLDTWQDKTTGENRSKLGIVLENFQFVGGGGSGGNRDGGAGATEDSYRQNRPPARQAPIREQKKPEAAPADNFEDDDVPF